MAKEPKHILKSWIGLFEPIYSGVKTHELRVMDRDFQVGDICLLREYDARKKLYTGRYCIIEITYITSDLHEACAFSPNALHRDMAVLSIKLLSTDQNDKDYSNAHKELWKEVSRDYPLEGIHTYDQSDAD